MLVEVKWTDEPYYRIAEQLLDYTNRKVTSARVVYFSCWFNTKSGSYNLGMLDALMLVQLPYEFFIIAQVIHTKYKES